MIVVLGQSLMAQFENFDKFKKFDQFYLLREKKMSPILKQKISMLRAQKISKKWSFRVAYTTAMDKAISSLAGLKKPGNVRQKIQMQDQRNQQFFKFQPKIKKFEYFKKKTNIPVSSSNMRKWDWRRQGKVSPVRNQRGCGSCWAFATLGAFEGNDRLQNSRNIDASEQCVLNCSGKGSCRGGWWAFDFLINKGVANESRYPYSARDGQCNNSAPRVYKATKWGYVKGQSPSISQLKKALIKYGPLAVAVHVSPSFQAYADGVYNNNVNKSINHGVTLIGWDDNKRAWIIKNSWGTGWGSTAGYGSEKGYMYIGYGCSKIGTYAAWVEAKKIPKPATEDCIPFNPNRLTVKRYGRDWKIVEGNHMMMGFGSKRHEAIKALAIIKRYRMNKMCFIGRPHPSMTYFLTNGKSPVGSMSGEDAIGFNLARLQVKRVGNDWKITDGRSWLLSFGNKKSEAYAAHKTIKKYGFTKICYVGRPHASMIYFRK